MEVYNSKTCVLEGSGMAVGGEGAGLWPPGKTTIWLAKVRFYQVLVTFQKVRWVQAPKELTLSVLEDVSRRIERNGAQHAGKRCKAPRRIYRLPPLPQTSPTLDDSMTRRPDSMT